MDNYDALETTQYLFHNALNCNLLLSNYRDQRSNSSHMDQDWMEWEATCGGRALLRAKLPFHNRSKEHLLPRTFRVEVTSDNIYIIN